MARFRSPSLSAVGVALIVARDGGAPAEPTAVAGDTLRFVDWFSGQPQICHQPAESVSSFRAKVVAVSGSVAVLLGRKTIMIRMAEPATGVSLSSPLARQRTPAHPLIAWTIRSSAICAARRLRHGIPEARPQRCRHMDESRGTPQGIINGASSR